MENETAITKIINTIVESDLKISEKLHLLNSFSSVNEEEVKQARINLIRGYRYCVCCNEWYLDESWQHTQTKTTRPVRTFIDKTADGDLYVDRYCDLLIDTCPVGHQFETVLRKNSL